MSKNKILLNHRVITKGGGGARRAVLDYDSGIIYAYQCPEYIIGVFEPKKGWVIIQAPEYSSGGWGRPSTGDADGYHVVQNGRELVEAIGGTLYRMNAKEFMTQKDFDALNAEISEHNKVLERRHHIAKKMGRDASDDKVYPLESIEIKKDFYRNQDAISPKGTDPIKTARRFEQAAKVFTERKGSTVTVDGYKIQRDLITQGETVVAFRDTKGDVFMNAQVLNCSPFERKFMGEQSLIQSAVRKMAKYSIPFNVLASAGLKLSETTVLEQGPEDTFELNSGTRHFTGALLLENAGRKFLMDVDRREIQHGIFNAFFVEVDSKVSSIESAYDSMKPQKVKDAEAAGIEVKRQGEWFFIDTGKTVQVERDHVFNGEWYLDRFDDDKRPTQYLLKSNVAHGKGRPNSLFKPVGFDGLAENIVCGTVEHSGREHAPLNLGVKDVRIMDIPQDDTKTDGPRREYRLWELVPNTTVSNFTIQGEVD